MSDVLRDAFELAASRTAAPEPEAPEGLAFESTSAPANPDDSPLGWSRLPLPGMIGRLEHQDVDSSQGGDRRLVPAWNLKHFDDEINDTMSTAVATAKANPELTHRGERAQVTRQVVISKKKRTAELLAGTKAELGKLVAEAESIVPRGGVPAVTSADERFEDLKIVEGVAAEGRARISSADPMARQRYLDEAKKDPRVRLAMARTPEALWGGSPGASERLRASYQARPSEEQARQLARLRDTGAVLQETVRHLEAIDARLDAIGDREVLKAAGLARLRRSDLRTDAERVAFIGQHGVEKFMALPA